MDSFPIPPGYISSGKAVELAKTRWANEALDQLSGHLVAGGLSSWTLDQTAHLLELPAEAYKQPKWRNALVSATSDPPLFLIVLSEAELDKLLNDVQRTNPLEHDGKPPSLASSANVEQCSTAAMTPEPHLVRNELVNRQPSIPARKRGPKAKKRDRVLAEMRKLDFEVIKIMKEEEMASKFKASRDTCRKCRNLVLSAIVDN